MILKQHEGRSQDGVGVSQLGVKEQEGESHHVLPRLDGTSTCLQLPSRSRDTLEDHGVGLADFVCMQKFMSQTYSLQ